MSKSKFAHFLVAALAIACNKEHPKPQVKAQMLDVHSIDVQKPSPQDAPLPHNQNPPRTAADGSPLFDHFVGERCALSRSGETWCPANRDSTVYYRLPINKPLRTVLGTGTPLTYLLAEDGQLYLMGQFDSDIDPKWSLDYSTPKIVPEFSDLVYLTNAGQYYGLRRSGQLVSWEFSEKRDEGALAVQIDQTPPKIAYPSPIKRITGDWGLCLEDAGGAWCTKDKANLATGYRIQLPSVTAKLPEPTNVSDSACFGASPGVLDCYAGWTRIGLGPQRLTGHFQLKVDARKVVADLGLVLDNENRLHEFDKPTLLINSPEELENPTLVHLTNLGQVADFEGALCVISVTGVLSCNAGDNWTNKVPTTPTFTLTPPPNVKGPGD